MHPDRKIGIAMGILLVGVVAALFFRNEPLHVNDGLSQQRESEINQHLRDRDVTVFLDNSSSDNGQPDSNGLEWSLDDMHGDLQAKEDQVPIPIGGRGVPLTPLDTSPANPNQTDEEVVTATKPNAVETEPKPQPDIDFIEYTVEFGDTLSGISQRFLGSQTRFREIYEANKDRMDSPDRLRVGKAIRIPQAIH